MKAVFANTIQTELRFAEQYYKADKMMFRRW